MPIYIGHKNDEIDLQLAKYINSMKAKLPILFLREQEGIYLFGQRRVYLKIGDGNKINVRVGTDFIDIDDFIAQYTTSEVKKSKRNADNDIITLF